METERPHCKPGLKCPLMRKDVSKVCHNCAWFSRITGTDPQTGAPVDHWACAMNMTVLATIDAGRASREAAATTQELRNDMQRERQRHTKLLMSQALAAGVLQPLADGSSPTPRAIESKVEN